MHSLLLVHQSPSSTSRSEFLLETTIPVPSAVRPTLKSKSEILTRSLCSDEELKAGQTEGLLFCVGVNGCGNPIHTDCFAHWAKQATPVSVFESSLCYSFADFRLSSVPVSVVELLGLPALLLRNDPSRLPTSIWRAKPESLLFETRLPVRLSRSRHRSTTDWTLG